MTAPRIDPDTARADIRSGALLVCAYDSEERCHENVLDGSISLREVEAHSARLSRDQEIIFYCA